MPNTIKLSQHGQVFLPESVCQAQHWKTGQELLIISLDDGILLKPKHSLPPTTLEEVAKCLPYRGPAKTLEEMEAAMAMNLENQEESRRIEWRKSDANNLVMRSGMPDATLDISLMEVEAVCGLYQASRSVSLEEMEEAIQRGAIEDDY